MNGGESGGNRLRGAGVGGPSCVNGHPMKDGAAFCTACGAAAAVMCSGGHPLAPGERFCSYCGAPAAPVQGSVVAPPTTSVPVSDNRQTWLVLGGIAVVVLLLAGVAAVVLRRDAPPTPTTSASRSRSDADDSDRATTSSRSGRGNTVIPEELKAELRAKGMESGLAECIVDGLVLRGVPLENFSGSPSSQDSAILTDLTTSCVRSSPSTSEVVRTTGVADAADYDLPSSDIRCSVDDVTGAMKASGTLTNRSATRQAYQIKIDFLGERNTKLGSGSGFTGDLSKGQKGTWDTLSFDSSVEGKKITCKVVEVDYSIFSTK